MGRVVMVAWRDKKGAVVGSFIGVHAVVVVVAITQVRVTMVGIRTPPGVGGGSLQ